MRPTTVHDAVPIPRAVLTVSADASVAVAARLMRTNDVHNLVVVNDRGDVTGVIAQRDMFGAVVDASGSMPSNTVASVSELMVRLPQCATDETTLEEALELMARYRCSALPIIRPTGLVGLITETDLLRALANILKEATPLEGARRKSVVTLANPLIQKALQLISDAGI